MKVCLMLLLTVFFSGCITTGEYEQIDSHLQPLLSCTIIDRYNDKALARQGTALYIIDEQRDTRRRVTEDPYIEGGFFVDEGRQIVYLSCGPGARRYRSEDLDISADTFYVQPADGDERSRKEISFEQYQRYLLDKMALF